MRFELDTIREHYLRAQLLGDRREAVRIILDEGVRNGTSILDLQTAVVQAAQVQMGQLWQQHRVTIAQEHMATAISQVALSALFERARPKPRLGKKLLLACVEDEQHELPARLVADLLELEGIDIRYLGADVPHDALVSSVERERPDAIGLSVTMEFNLDSLRTAVTRLRAVTDARIVIGGRACQLTEGLADDLGVECDGASPSDLVATANRVLAVH